MSVSNFGGGGLWRGAAAGDAPACAERSAFFRGLVVGGATAVAVTVVVLRAAGVLRHPPTLPVMTTQAVLAFDPNPVGASPPTLADIRRIAQARLPSHVWKYVTYASGEGHTTHHALRAAFRRWQLRPRILNGPSVDATGDVETQTKQRATTATTLFGCSLAAPLLVAPTSFHGLYCRGGEAATAYGAARAGVGYCYNFALAHVRADDVNTASADGARARHAGGGGGGGSGGGDGGASGAAADSAGGGDGDGAAEGVGDGAPGVRWAHVYIFKDREYVLWTLREAARLGFDAVIVTSDHPHDRVKEDTMPIFEPHAHDVVHPPRRRARCPSAGARTPAANHRDMQLGETLSELMTFGNLEAYRASRPPPPPPQAAAAVAAKEDSSSAGENDGGLTFADLAWVCRHTSLPVVCKGVLTPEDALLAIRAGCRGVCVSNHGGRQLDHAVPAIDALPGVVAALREHHPEVPVLVDSGFRTGTHVLTALALGAHAVLIGRPTLFGLAAGGAEGVQYVFERLSRELHFDMQAVGASSPASLRDQAAGSAVLVRTGSGGGGVGGGTWESGSAQ